LINIFIYVSSKRSNIVTGCRERL